MEIQLKILVGGNTGQLLKVPGPKFFIGRAEDCQLRPRSDLVSRHHCVLIVDNGTLLVRDFGSKNGTLVNDERVSGEVELHAGDQMKVGPLHFEVLIDYSKSQKRPKVNSIKEAAARTAEGRPAPDRGADLGVDVDDWLANDEAQPTETRELPKVETQTLNLDQTVEMPAPPPAEEEAKPKAPPAKPPSSENAAADMLRKLRKFR